MSNPPLGLLLAEPRALYFSGGGQEKWVEVLVDCPGVQGIYTYRNSLDASINPGDVLSVSFGTQQLGAIAIRIVDSPPPNLPREKIKAHVCT
ncbi:MAG: primosomal protein N', partial [Moorea sp. SIO3H5]|nr:primosomal protein N' [Moorena sp. SIO3H5]